MQRYINPAVGNLPASAIITLDKSEQFRHGQLDVQTITISPESYRMSGTEWATGKFAERDHDYAINAMVAPKPVRDEIIATHATMTLPLPAEMAESAQAGPTGRFDNVPQIIAESMNRALTNKVLPLEPKVSAFDNKRISTPAERRWREDHPTRSDVVNEVAREYARDGWSDKDAFTRAEAHVGERDPLQVRTEWRDAAPSRAESPENWGWKGAVEKPEPKPPLTSAEMARENWAMAHGPNSVMPSTALGFTAAEAAQHTEHTDFLAGLPRETPTPAQAKVVTDAQRAAGVPAYERAMNRWAQTLQESPAVRSMTNPALRASMARHPTSHGPHVR